MSGGVTVSVRLTTPQNLENNKHFQALTQIKQGLKGLMAEVTDKFKLTVPGCQVLSSL